HFLIDNMIEDEVSQNMSNKSALEEYRDISSNNVNNKLVKIKLEDFED
ncbi:1314_t:CDS:1, partial [Cetraspora pellucida]